MDKPAHRASSPWPSAIRKCARWEGNVATIGAAPESHPEFPGTMNLGLFCYRSSFDFSNVRLRVNDGRASELRKTPPLAAAQPFDLLANTKIPADVRLGNWRMVDGVLYTPPQENGITKAALYLSPDRPVSEEYDVELVVERKDAGGTGMVVGFVTGGRQATAMLDSYGGNPPRWGIDDIDGKNLRDGNPTNNPGLRLTLDQKKTVRIEVRRGGVRVFVEAEKVVDWQGRPEQLSTNFWNVEKKQSLFLGSQARFHIHKLTLTPR